MRWLLASFLYASHIVIALPNIFLLLKTIARSTEKLIGFAFTSKKEQQLSLLSNQEKKSKEFTSKLKHKD